LKAKVSPTDSRAKSPARTQAADATVTYYGYDSNETVPNDMCLVGCIFYMGDYIKYEGDICEQWTKVSAEHSALSLHLCL